MGLLKGLSKSVNDFFSFFSHFFHFFSFSFLHILESTMTNI